MATATFVARTVVDHEPGGHAPISVSNKELDSGFAIELRQGDDTVWASLEHAEALHAALTACIAEAKALAA